MELSSLSPSLTSSTLLLTQFLQSLDPTTGHDLLHQVLKKQADEKNRRNLEEEAKNAALRAALQDIRERQRQRDGRDPQELRQEQRQQVDMALQGGASGSPVTTAAPLLLASAFPVNAFSAAAASSLVFSSPPIGINFPPGVLPPSLFNPTIAATVSQLAGRTSESNSSLSSSSSNSLNPSSSTQIAEVEHRFELPPGLPAPQPRKIAVPVFGLGGGDDARRRRSPPKSSSSTEEVDRVGSRPFDRPSSSAGNVTELRKTSSQTASPAPTAGESPLFGRNVVGSDPRLNGTATSTPEKESADGDEDCQVVFEGPSKQRPRKRPTPTPSGPPLKDHGKNHVYKTTLQEHLNHVEKNGMSLNRHQAIALRLRYIAEHVIRSLNEYGWAVVDNFIGPNHCKHTYLEMEQLYKRGLFSPGQLMENKSDEYHIKDIRSDQIYWFDSADKRAEDAVTVRLLISMIDSVIVHFARRIPPYQIGGRSRAMIAIYPGNGTRYVKHVDNPVKDGRCITSIYYCNESWDMDKDGGGLRLYPETSATPMDIDPQADRLVFFWSDRRNPHEVLPVYRNRFAITIWYFDKKEKAEAVERMRQQLKESSGGPPATRVKMEMGQEALDEKANSLMASLPTTSSAPSILRSLPGQNAISVEDGGADSGVEDEAANEAILQPPQPAPARSTTPLGGYGSLPDVDTALEQMHTASMLASFPGIQQPGLFAGPAPTPKPAPPPAQPTNEVEEVLPTAPEFHPEYQI